MTRIVKGISLVSLLAFFLLGGGIISCFFWEESRRRAWLVRWMHFLSPSVLRVLEIHCSLSLRKNIPENTNYLIVSNHLSYIDVLLIATATPTVFVTSVEVKHSFLGLFARAAGALFVERRKRNSVGPDIQKISSVLKEGFHVALFPEGTTSDGKKVLPFKSPLLEAAVHAGVEILPVAINYSHIDGYAIDTQSGDKLFYYGTMDFGPHLWNLLTVHQVWADLQILFPLSAVKTSCRKELARQCHQHIQMCYVPVPESLHSSYLPAMI